MAEPRVEIAKGIKAAHPVIKDIATITDEQMVQRALENPENFKASVEIPLEPEIARKKTQESLDQITDAGIKAEAQTAAKSILDYLDGKQPANRDEIRQAVFNVLKNKAAFHDQLAGGLTDADVIARLDRYIGDPEFELYLRRQTGEVLETEISPDLTSEIAAKKDALDLAEFKHQRKSDEAGGIEKEIEEVKNQLKLFDRSDPDPDQWVGNAKKIKDLKAEKPKLESEIKIWRVKLEGAEKDVESWEKYLDDFDRRNKNPMSLKRDEILQNLEDVRNDADGHRLEFQTRQQKLSELQQLEAEEAQLRNQQKTLQESFTEAQIEEKKLKNEFNDATREWEKAKKRLEGVEKSIRDGLQGVWGRAGVEWANAQIRPLVEAMYALHQEHLAAVAGTKMEVLMRELGDDLFEKVPVTYRRWLGLRKETKEEWQPKTATIEKRWEKLFTDGFDGLMEDFLVGKTNPETGKPFDKAGVAELFRDADFREKAHSQVLQRLVAAKLLDGGLNQKEIFAFTALPQGEKLLEKGMEHYAAFRKGVDQEAEKGGFAGAPPKEKARRALALNPWLLLPLLGMSIPTAFKDEERE